MKEYQALQKKLHSRRLDYDSKLAKVQKAKKEKPEWEEEMQSAKAKYEETREHVLGIMAAIHETQASEKTSIGERRNLLQGAILGPTTPLLTSIYLSRALG